MVRLKVAGEDLVRLGVNESLASSYDDTELRERIGELEEGKVDKVAGKGLSTNDYTDADKAEVAKIEGIEEDIDSLDLSKANIDGYYDTLSVGLADNLIDRKGNGTPQEISYRTSCGDDSIADDGNGIIQSIFGKSVVWNQLIKHSMNYQTYSAYGLTITKTGDIYVLNGTATQDAHFALDSTTEKVVANHKYYVRGCPNGGSNNKYALVDAWNGYYRELGEGVIFTPSTGNSCQDAMFVKNGVTVENIVYSKPIRVDLTQLFGSGNEPTTVDDPRIEWVKQYANDHPEYNSGELVSYAGSGIKTVGFNQFDISQIKTTDWNVNGNEITNKITDTRTAPSFWVGAVKNNTTVKFFRNNITSVGKVGYLFDFSDYDYDYIRIKHNGLTKDIRVADVIVPSHQKFYFTANVTGVNPTVVGGIVMSDINFNLSWSGYRNGEYEPYWSRTLNLPISQYFPDGMKSAGSVRDEMTKDKAVKRIGSRAYQSGDENDTSVVTDGTTTYYPLETPIETTITPPLDLTYKVADFGTEESIAEGKSTPFNGIIKYSDDFTRGLVNMPKNYDTTASLDALATSLSTMLTSALDGTVTITRGAYDSTNKTYAWNCSFTPNA